MKFNYCFFVPAICIGSMATWTGASSVSSSPLVVETANIRRKAQAVAVPILDPIVRFEIINAVTDTKIGDLINGTVIDLSKHGLRFASELNFVAVIEASGIESSTVRSIRFALDDDPKFMIENLAPFALCGNNGADYSRCTKLKLGVHNMTAFPYSLTKNLGAMGIPVSISFEVVAKVTYPATIAPTRAPINAPTTAPTAPATATPTFVPTHAPSLAPTTATPTVTEVAMLDYLHGWMVDSASRIQSSDSTSDDMKQFVSATSQLVEHLMNNNANP